MRKSNNLVIFETLFPRNSTNGFLVLSELGQTVLHIACIKEDVEIVSCLVVRSINAAIDLLNMKDNIRGSTALHLAASIGNSIIVDLLLQYGADYTINNSFDEPPILQAVLFSRKGNRKHYEVLKVFLKHGITLEDSDLQLLYVLPGEKKNFEDILSKINRKYRMELGKECKFDFSHSLLQQQ